MYKHVVGGSKTAGDFTIHVNIIPFVPPNSALRNSNIFDKVFAFLGVTNAFAGDSLYTQEVASFLGDEGGTLVSFSSQEAYDYEVTEDIDSNYTTSYGENCTGSISSGESKSCTVTNTLIVVTPQGSGPLLEYTQPEINGDQVLPPPENTGSVPGIVPVVENLAPIGQVLGVQTFKFVRTLRLGMVGDDVLELHKKLTELGFYKGLIDNKFQLLLEAAVKAFQKANPPLVVDGIVGPATRAVLNK